MTPLRQQAPHLTPAAPRVCRGLKGEGWVGGLVNKGWESEEKQWNKNNYPLDSPRQWHVPMLNKVLLWHGHTKLDVSKLGKDAKMAMVRGIIEDDATPPAFEKWLPADEERLKDLMKMKIEIGDTAVGRVAAVRKKELLASVPTMDGEERATLRRKLDQLEGIEPAAT